MRLNVRTAIVATALALSAGLAASAGASTLTGTTDINTLSSLSIGGTTTFDTTGASGIGSGAYPADSNRVYFDYLYKFTLTGTDPAKVVISAGATPDNHFGEFHVLLTDYDPTDAGGPLGGSTTLYYDHDADMYKHYDDVTHLEVPNDNFIDIKEGTPFNGAGSGNGDGGGIDFSSLNAGTYYLRFFGVTAPDFNTASPSSGAFSGSISASAIVATTPLPPALLMFMTALGGLGFAGWRRRRQAIG